jgi:peroxiredoxin
LDAAPIEQRSHRLLSPIAVELKACSPKELADAGAGAGAKCCQLQLGGLPLRLFIWVENGSYRYAALQGSGKPVVAADERPIERPSYVSLTGLQDDAGLSLPLRAAAGGGAEPRWIRLVLPNGREGIWSHDGVQTRVGLIDVNQDGRFDDLENTRLLLDLDHDGEFDLGSNTVENLDAAKCYRFGDFTFAVKIDPAGRRLLLAESSGDAMTLNVLKLGAPAPNFHAVDFQGKKVSLADYRGKFVFFDVWATWCGPCIAEIPNVQAAAVKYKGSNLVVLGVSIDGDAETARDFVERKELTYGQLWAPNEWESDVCRLYQIHGIPATFLIDPAGNLISQSLRGAELEKSLAMIAKYDSPEGKRFFEQRIAEAANLARITKLTEEGRYADALKLLDQMIQSTTEPDAVKKLKRTRTYLSANQ